MKNTSNFFKLIAILICFNSCAQEKPNCSDELKKSITPLIFSLNEARKVYKTTTENYQQIIKNKIETLNDISNSQPEKFGKLKIKSDKIESITSDLNGFIELLKEESITNHFDNYNYEMMSDTLFYRNILFDKNNNLSKRGLKLKNKIQNFHKTCNEILNSSQQELKWFNDSNFNTEVSFSDYDGNKIDFMNFKLSNRSVIGTLTYLEKLQLELVTFQFFFMNSIVQ
ncbi:hypothetical protein [Tenacibaculum sp. nBUS_03]|uniref:hypothetical protein n=1 Tax=Tenacibaculum sp. nBUS_03 TaxID=3395320 RepID=UPI003EB775CD